MKKILMLAMGGTIASEISEHGLRPGLGPEQILSYVPEISKLCEVDTKCLYSIDSTNTTPKHVLHCAKVIEENYADYDGFVITHGTDTLAYTAAILSYLIQASKKAIILTGAQKPIHFADTDSRINLYDAFLAATSDKVRGVNIVFNGNVINGTRARKIRSKNYNAFASINYPMVATIHDRYISAFIEQDYLEEPKFYHELEENINLVKLLPNNDTSLLRYAFEESTAVIIESFGVGGLPRYPNDPLDQALKDFLKAGKFLVMSTQTPLEGSDMGVYSVGYDLKFEENILEAYDMTTEAVFAKLMWILAQTKDVHEVRKLFYTPVANDIYPHK